MTVSVPAEPVSSPRPGTGDRVEHISCCEATQTVPGPVLCGSAPETWNGRYVEECPPEDLCVVCRDLAAAGTCPVHGRCPWEEPR